MSNVAVHQQALLYFGSDQAVTQVAPRGCGVSLVGDFQKARGHVPEQPPLGCPAGARCLD